VSDGPWELPDGWVWARADEIASIVGGGTPPTSDAANFAAPGMGVPWITPADLSGYTSKSIARGARDLTQKGLGSSSARLIPADSVLFSSRAPIGYVAIAAGHVSTNQGFKSLVPTEGVLPDYLYYYLFRARKLAEELASGTTFKEVSGARMAQLPIPVAPIVEQSRIVDALESYLPRLEDAAASLQRAQARLKAYRASVLNAAVEGRLVPPEAELARKEKRDYEPADVLLKHILAKRRRRWEQVELARLKAAGRPPKDDRWRARYVDAIEPNTKDLPNLPEGWCWVSIDQLAALDDNSLCDGPFGSNLKTSHYTETGPRVVRLQNIGDGEFVDEEAHISQEHFQRLRKHEVNAGDLIIASLGTELPRVCRVPAALGPAIVKADCLRFCVNPALGETVYVMHALNSPTTRKRTETLVHGVGRPRIGLTLMRSIQVPLPPRVEQGRIADAIESLFSMGSAIAGELDRQNAHLSRLRQSTLKWAFEGRLADQNAGEEPAAALLERLRHKSASASFTRSRKSA
jgi:type I restriction enzyme, S subunit